jgi:GTP-binding protein
MINKAIFVGSFQKLNQCPESALTEFAFIGRSNVGKSSLINMLCKVKNLALTSSTPGKTQLINYFLINDTFHLVDLPGYGYARVSKTQRQKWHKHTMEYVTTRTNLAVLFILIDATIPPQQIDIEFINRMGESRVPFVLIYTKTDKINQRESSKNIALFEDKLKEKWEELPISFKSSAKKGLGHKEILTFISETLKETA